MFDNGKSDLIVWVIDIPIDLLLEIESRFLNLDRAMEIFSERLR